MLIESIALWILFFWLKKRFVYIQAIIFAIFIALYIQGNYLIANLPVLDGSVPKWEDYDTDKAISIIVWFLVFLVCFVLLYKMGSAYFVKAISVCSVCIVAMLLFTGIVLLITNDGLQRKPMSVATTKNEFEMSADTNFIILLVDTVDSKTTDFLFDKHPEYSEYFRDFTYYSNTVAGYNCTMEAVPFILSGVWYENEKSFDEYLAEVYGESSLFEQLERLGYDISMYTNCVSRVEDKSVYRFSNVEEVEVGEIKNASGFIELMFEYVGFRYLPYQYKKYCFESMKTDFDDYRQVPDEYELVEDANNGIFYEKMKKEKIISLTDKKVFKLIHLEGGHVPCRYNEHVEEVDNATYESQVEATMTIVHSYLEHLKKADVYDNSTIIVMADHGNDAINESRGPRYNAFLMIKGIGENKSFEISQAPISHADMSDAFGKLLDGVPAGDIFDWKEGDERERRFFSYEFGWEDEMYEYIIGTDSKNSNCVYSTGRIY